MLVLANIIALTIIGGVFLYTIGFARRLLKKKLYRGAIGVFILGALQVSVSLYTLYMSKF